MQPSPAESSPPASPPSRAAAWVRWFFESLVRLYFPTIVVDGAERIPAGPVVYVPNHANALLDPLVLRLGLQRPVRFLAKSTLFGNPVGSFVMNAFGAIPVYRRHDAAAGASGDNERTFAICREALGRGEAIALFPEGTSHSDPRLKPLKTGAARIVLGAQAMRQNAGRVALVPVGLVYEQKATFRSTVLVVVGAPIATEDASALWQHDERRAAETLTTAVRAGLDQVVLQADSREVLEGAARLASSVTTPSDATVSPVEHYRQTRALLAAYHRLQTEAPDELASIVNDARRYLRLQHRLHLAAPPGGPPHAAERWAWLLFATFWPVALMGALLGWVPYRVTGLLAPRLTREEDVLSTLKLLLGALLLPATWTAEGVAAAKWYGPWAALALAIAAPVTGYGALVFDEAFARVRAHVRRRCFAQRFPAAAARLETRRQALARRVARAAASEGASLATPP